MKRLWVAVAFCGSLAVLGAAKKTGEGEGGNEKVQITASVVPNDELNQSFHHDFGGHFTAIDVKITPKGGPLDIKLDDFLLRSDRDGDHSTPFPATQIAGEGALLVSKVEASAGPTGNTTDRGWRLPGGLGSGGGERSSDKKKKKKTEASDDAPAPPPKNPDEEAHVDPAFPSMLTSRVLAEKPASEPVSGLLFFSLEKQKAKDLELIYTTPSGKVRIRFK